MEGKKVTSVRAKFGSVFLGKRGNELEAEASESQSGTGNEPLVSRGRGKKRGYTRRYLRPREPGRGHEARC